MIVSCLFVYLLFVLDCVLFVFVVVLCFSWLLLFAGFVDAFGVFRFGSFVVGDLIWMVIYL